MPGTSFDGSIWVTSAQAGTVVVGSALSAVLGGMLINRATRQLNELEAREAKEGQMKADDKARRRKMTQGPPQKQASKEPSDAPPSDTL
mmetsp:Transcript_47399/g.90506  ORF Transcript_47399/g.90506 Transcript_47399/m.90506 type:complete len:89 (-) Transcript_47399:221-487(-)|eukprot:CAMPEP_0114227982 /NCGR_PEP_ID=MMETSP0058-20121206/2091_1 /TAXON_ID=36894 /ORGANISM="Pyramimonas parkeae, CCMP726" /LENGTH=88 /DNA_ID=CAMNT_0001338881 /DNA_START=116 /DNA_END=382 /DNA_ORIENTATION=+